MKKYSVLLVLIALMSLVCNAFAEITLDNLPSIDEEAAAEYLGVWHMDSVCIESGCFSMKGFGADSQMEILPDNTIIVKTEDTEDEIQHWYMEEGVAYTLDKNEAGEIVPFAMTLDDQGRLSIGENGDAVIFTREEAVVWGSGAVKSDAKLEDFVGEWGLYSMGDDEMSFPVSLLGMTGVLDIREDKTFDLSMMDEHHREIKFDFVDGKITGVIVNAEDETKEDPFVIEYHEDGAIVFAFSPDTESKTNLVFIPKDKMSTLNIGDLLTALTEEPAAAEETVVEEPVSEEPAEVTETSEAAE